MDFDGPFLFEYDNRWSLPQVSGTSKKTIEGENDRFVFCFHFGLEFEHIYVVMKSDCPVGVVEYLDGPPLHFAFYKWVASLC